MAKRVVVDRKEFELTNAEAKQYILDHILAAKGVYVEVESFARVAKEQGLEASQFGDLKCLINELIKEGKLRIEYEYFHAGPASGYFPVIKRIG